MADHHCYLVQAGAYVKIGYSADLRQRLKDMQISCPHPLRVILLFKYDTEQAAREMEKFLHEKLKNHKAHGEWFKASKVINRMKREHKHVVRHMDLDEDQRFHLLSI